jgi:hypothetical protein
MEPKIYFLDSEETNKIIKILKVLFGILCLVIAGFWIYINMNAIKSDSSIWITILFLSGFGIYQILSGSGKTRSYIELNTGNIRLKKNALLLPKTINATDLKKIELFPLNIVFIFNTDEKTTLRFGTTYQITNEQITDELLTFAERNNIPLEVIEDKL